MVALASQTVTRAERTYSSATGVALVLRYRAARGKHRVSVLRDGQCVLTCERESVELARREWRRIVSQLIEDGFELDS